MKFLKKLWSLLFGKKEKAPVVEVGYTADIVIDESDLAPIVEVSDETAEEIADIAVPTKKKKYIKKKK